MSENERKMTKYWMRKKLETRILGALEELVGIGIIAGAYATRKEIGNLTIPMYMFGGLAIADGVCDLIYGFEKRIKWKKLFHKKNI